MSVYESCTFLEIVDDLFSIPWRLCSLDFEIVDVSSASVFTSSTATCPRAVVRRIGGLSSDVSAGAI